MLISNAGESKIKNEYPCTEGYSIVLCNCSDSNLACWGNNEKKKKLCKKCMYKDVLAALLKKRKVGWAHWCMPVIPAKRQLPERLNTLWYMIQ